MLNYLYSLLWPTTPPHRLGWSIYYGQASDELQEESGMVLDKVMAMHHGVIVDVVKLSPCRGVPSVN